jgi:hypothetical protein
MVWGIVPDSSTNAFASGLTKQFTVFCGLDDDHTCSKPIVMVTQPIQGTDSSGFTDVQFLFMPGNPGEYTFSFGSGVISSPPLTVYVTNSLANIELVDEPTTVNASVEFRVGEHLPVPDVRLSAADGTTRLGGFRPVLKFVDEDGSDAPTLMKCRSSFVGSSSSESRGASAFLTRDGGDERGDEEEERPQGSSHTHAHRPCYVITRFFRSTSSGLSGRKGVIIRSGNGVRFAGGSLFLTAASANPAPSRAACTATTREKSGGGENGDSRRFVQTFDGAIIFVSA